LPQSPDLTISSEAGIARLQFGEKILFESGSAQTKAAAGPALLAIANLLRIIPYTVIVEGHTDDVPLTPGSRFKSNRELSLARAMAIVHLLIDKGDLEPRQLAASAYGPFKPRSSNLTAAGRRLNRRVEIVFVKDFPYALNPVGGRK